MITWLLKVITIKPGFSINNLTENDEDDNLKMTASTGVFI